MSSQKSLSETQWQRWLNGLLDSSSAFEGKANGSAISATEALALLGSLEQVTRQSMFKEFLVSGARSKNAEVPNPGAAPFPQAQRMTHPPAPKPASQVPSRFGSNNKSYSPALQDRSIIQALLDLQRQRKFRGNILKPNDVKLGAPAFTAASAPVVEAAPKPEANPLAPRKAPPVLRPGRSGNS